MFIDEEEEELFKKQKRRITVVLGICFLPNLLWPLTLGANIMSAAAPGDGFLAFVTKAFFLSMIVYPMIYLAAVLMVQSFLVRRHIRQAIVCALFQLTYMISIVLFMAIFLNL